MKGKSIYSLSNCLNILIIFSFLNCSSEPIIKPKSLVSIDFEIQGNGTVKPNSGLYDINSRVVFEAIADSGYYFDRWEGFAEVLEQEKYELVLTGDLNLSAIFLPIPELSSEIKIYNPKKIDPNPIFIIENGGDKAYLTDKTGEKLKVWNFDSKLGNDLELMMDGSLIGLFKSDDVFFSFGGYGGTLKKFNPSGILEWEYEVNNENELAHHDFEILPNGNILLLVWERFSEEEAINFGFSGTGEIFLEKIIEINPSNDSIIWEWRSKDHLIQEFDLNKLNYGKISEFPQKIDLNYNQIENGDLMHANGLCYDQKRNLIYLSVNFYSEIWAIPHQYDTQTTKTEKGDLAFRFGNPNAFDSSDKRIFFNNHHPNIVSLHQETSDNFLIYMNGSKNNQSSVYEFTLPFQFESDPKNWLQPELFWEFSNTDLFSAKISGCIRLPNGNTLICEGDFGYWEVTSDKDVVWKYEGDTTFWRGYVYPQKR